jgi:predicted amidohydrolase
VSSVLCAAAVQLNSTEDIERNLDTAEQVVVSELARGLRVGMSIGYDVRFPELYRELSARGAEILAVPSAFTLATTRDHWEVLLRARAIENQCFVIAPNQIGEHAPGMRSGGRSMIIDPWGVVLATASDGEGMAVADLDFDRLGAIRHRMPVLKHRRDPALYARGSRATPGVSRQRNSQDTRGAGVRGAGVR